MYTEYADSTLMGMTKKELIKLLRVAEHNKNASEIMLEQQYQNTKNWIQPKFGHWVECATGIKCSECGAREKYNAQYTHTYCYKCGAIMNKKAFLDSINNSIKLNNVSKSGQIFTDLKYAEENTDQCWTCSRRTGMLQHVITVNDAEGNNRLISVYLPQCGACDDRGMLWVNQKPCPYYVNQNKKDYTQLSTNEITEEIQKCVENNCD